MFELLDMAKFFLKDALRSDAVLCDFTMGNGHDTEYLCRSAPEGKVYAFDIQENALKNTAARLSAAGLHNAVLIHDSHANCEKYIHEPLDGGMFNLGYLPGGDKRITTLRATTMPAVEAAIDLLAPDGIVCIAVYPGHAEGEAEGKMLAEYLSGLPRWQLCATQIKILNSPTSPYFIIVEKKAAL